MGDKSQYVTLLKEQMDILLQELYFNIYFVRTGAFWGF